VVNSSRNLHACRFRERNANSGPTSPSSDQVVIRRGRSKQDHVPLVRPFTTDTLGAATRAVSPDVRIGGALWRMMTVLGTEALICYRVDIGEQASRVQAEAGSCRRRTSWSYYSARPSARRCRSRPRPDANATR
jgi:hypothetical protein